MGTILAIDPGLSGALVLMDRGTGDYIDHLFTPTMKLGSKNRINGAAISAWTQQYATPEHVFLEQVNAMPGGGKGGPKMGAASAFTFGHSAGYVEGLIVGANLPYSLVSPTKWKTHAGLIGTDKDAARSRAIQLYPTLRVLDLKAKGQALADALLIGRYGISTL